LRASPLARSPDGCGDDLEDMTTPACPAGAEDADIKRRELDIQPQPSKLIR
jgi:hypothetical protein